MTMVPAENKTKRLSSVNHTLKPIHYLHTHRPTDRETDRQRDRETERETDRQTERQRASQTDRQIGIEVFLSALSLLILTFQYL